jgi:hypothetical protein
VASRVSYDPDVTRATARDAVIVFLVPVILYIASGAAGAYLANDDFNWLTDARTRDLSQLFNVAGRTHFYRPVVELWFAIFVRVCGDWSSCYHVLNLVVRGAHRDRREPHRRPTELCGHLRYTARVAIVHVDSIIPG